MASELFVEGGAFASQFGGFAFLVGDKVGEAFKRVSFHVQKGSPRIWRVFPGEQGQFLNDLLFEDPGKPYRRVFWGFRVFFLRDNPAKNDDEGDRGPSEHTEDAFF